MLANLARVYTTTIGTGPLSLGAAVSGYLTFAQAGIPDAAPVWYSVRDDVSGGSEVGLGTHSLAGPTLTRDTVYRSTGAGNTGKIALSGSAQVMVTVLAETFEALARVTMSDTPPASPIAGNLWFDTVQGDLYIRFQDADSAQWIPAFSNDPPSGLVAGGGGGIPEAPITGIGYGRQNGAWTPVLMLTGDVLDGGNYVTCGGIF
jgi:hypothetical protein